MGNMIVGFVVGHQEYILGIVTGYALGHIPDVVSFLFNQAMRVSFVRAAVLRDPEKLKKYIDEIEQTLDKEIDEEVAKAKPVEPPPTA